MKMNRSNQRSGVTLLMVMSIIVLFLLMGTTFVIISNNFLKSARQKSKFRLKGDQGQVLVERALYDIIRGPDLNNTMSPLRGHSLLGDMYGYGIRAVIDTATSDGSRHFMWLRFEDRGTWILDDSIVNLNGPGGLPLAPGLLNGLLVTVVSGEATGLTTRVVEDQVRNGFHHYVKVQIIGGDREMVATNANALQADPATGRPAANVVINGRPFAGTGAGSFLLNPEQDKPALHARRVRTTSDPPKLLPAAAAYPNQVGYSRDEMIKGIKTLDGVGEKEGYMARGTKLIYGTPFPNYNPPINVASTNESYDAFDVQNMFLGGYDVKEKKVIPSFYRGENVGKSFFVDLPGIQNANPNAQDLANPPVDNDNDGQGDGFWMDIGLPMQSDGSGRIYKPLVSYYVVDQGGKLNVNAHGNLTQVDADGPWMSDYPLLGGAQLNRGQGYGPPEVNLDAVVGVNGELALLKGAVIGSETIHGRYGANQVPGISGRDPWSRYRLFGYPYASFGAQVPGTIGNHFMSSAMDIHGQFQVGFVNNAALMDPYNPQFPIGTPIAAVASSKLPNELLNSAYEADFSPEPFVVPGLNGDNSHYALQELERLLRPYDADSRLLPERLSQLLSFAGWPANNSADPRADRQALTTDSYEVPTTYENLAGKLFEILSANPGVGLPGVDPVQKVRDDILKMLSPETLRGLPLDVNRPFGDGVDNNGNNVIDDVDESFGTESIPHRQGNVNFDHDNDSDDANDNDAYLARYHFARHLYVLTLLTTEMVDRNGDGKYTNDWYDFNQDDKTETNFPSGKDRTDYRKVIAQWVANVVDFRDPDSIMTPFEFDTNPWNGWDTDGDLTTTGEADRVVVWGMERPELLITETFAAHDRRTQDLNTEAEGDVAGGVGDGTRTNDPDDPDLEYDSQLVPVASAFIELYNPWVKNAANQMAPGELYVNRNGRVGVDLQKKAGGDPVWRITVADATRVENGQPTRTWDPDDSANNDGGTVNSLRTVYFVKPDNFSGPEVYFPSSTVPIPLEPGRYAVVGSGGVSDGANYTTYFGRRNVAGWEAELPKTRRIVMRPGANQLTVFEDDGTGQNVVADNRQNVVCVPIDRQNVDPNNPTSRSLGFSDPIDGYIGGLTDPSDGSPVELVPVADGFAFQNSVTGAPVTFDAPVDKKKDLAEWDSKLAHDGIWQNQALQNPGASTPTTSFRIVYLQRLANPLLPFDPVTNPYRTVDSNSVDLFTFCGTDQSDGPKYPTVLAPEPVKQQERFGTYERRSTEAYDPPGGGVGGPGLPGGGGGGINTANGTQGQQTDISSKRFRMLWKTDWDGKMPQRAQVAQDSPKRIPPRFPLDNHYLKRDLAHTLGRLNKAYIDNTVGGQQPFAWLNWNNRPYVSQLELANVPWTSSFWLTDKFDTAEKDRDVYNPSPRYGSAATTPAQHAPGQFTGSEQYSGRYGHLLNMHGDSDYSPGLQRTLDFLQVPSRFVGADHYVNPATFSNQLHDPPTDASGNPCSYPFDSNVMAAPFDAISNYRNPGKINLNTVTDPRIWNALMGEYAAAVPYDDWAETRSGSINNTAAIDPANPYRAANAFNRVWQQADVRLPSDTGLFRRGLQNGNDPNDKAGIPRPLFDFYSDPNAQANNTTRNAYFKHDMRQRLGNLATTRSSVFAIWITVGLFEVNPDGTVSDRELGSDSGEVRRHRGFFVLDRSIPVAFEPGKNHNVERAIRVSSFIE